MRRISTMQMGYFFIGMGAVLIAFGFTLIMAP
jgi:hypothetical protein